MNTDIDIFFLKKLLMENNINPGSIAIIHNHILVGRPIEVIVEEIAGIKLVKRLTGGND